MVNHPRASWLLHHGRVTRSPLAWSIKATHRPTTRFASSTPARHGSSRGSHLERPVDPRDT
eukprot:13965165-Alexandrium_andersonii.AAC.1